MGRRVSAPRCTPQSHRGPIAAMGSAPPRATHVRARLTRSASGDDPGARRAAGSSTLRADRPGLPAGSRIPAAPTPDRQPPAPRPPPRSAVVDPGSPRGRGPRGGRKRHDARERGRRRRVRRRPPLQARPGPVRTRAADSPTARMTRARPTSAWAHHCGRLGGDPRTPQHGIRDPDPERHETGAGRTAVRHARLVGTDRTASTGGLVEREAGRAGEQGRGEPGGHGSRPSRPDGARRGRGAPQRPQPHWHRAPKRRRAAPRRGLTASPPGVPGAVVALGAGEHGEQQREDGETATPRRPAPAGDARTRWSRGRTRPARPARTS